MKIVTDIGVLRKPSSNIDDVDECKEIIRQLEKTLAPLKHGVGLSAVQIGVHKKVGVLNRAGRNGVEMLHLINTELIDSEEEFIFEGEGCLSLNQKPAKCKRFRHITITNDKVVDDHFEKEELYFWHAEDVKDLNSDGITAIAIQHEIDHFQGKLIIDRSPYEVDASALIESSLKPFVDMAKQKIGRNDPCPCGKKNNKGQPVKFKKCCINRL